ncbi:MULTISPECIES: DUF4328 domain-containing protein [Streptomyces]|uniref:DUF4328 domain-containing protein n=1 Tax=Streptomyces spororaveus TaxID=284039 RepID=A0ABQ3TJW5_9ACTN|nr:MULTISPECIES: DUF4328 domain-containing protein [Streptomyces]MCM9079396.1 DUF4328 domain-containing protein [Streptomyces spororaveus]MCX5306188.1 DUF4328 domain-containing protein [Streptomyces sp. NBC_00160]GHI80282.1 hypothetical protein Sspor_58430 [Streptomyces spororaveus]
MSFNAPGTPPPPQYGDVLRSPQGLATALTVLLCVAGGINLLSAGTNAFTLSLMNDLDADPARVSSSMTDLSDILTGLAGIFQLLAYLATAVVFLVWFHRVRVNGEIFAATAFSLGRGWAVGWWFIPVAHLFMPFVTARQIWRASTQLKPDGSPVRVSAAPLTAWWAVWIVASIAGRISGMVYMRAETPGERGAAAALGIGSDLLMVAAAVLAVLFVRRLTDLQNTMAAQGPYAPVQAAYEGAPAAAQTLR